MKILALLLSILAGTTLIGDVTFYGPKMFVREKAGPTEFTDVFSVCRTDGTFTLHVVNGDSSGQNKISSAMILVNNVEVVKQSDFNQNTAAIDKTIPTISSQNTIDIRITSNPGGQITLAITGTVSCGVQIKIDVPSAGETITNGHVVLRGRIWGAQGYVSASISPWNALIDFNHGGTQADPFLYALDYPLMEEPGQVTLTVVAKDSYTTSQDSLALQFQPVPQSYYLNPSDDSIKAPGQVAFDVTCDPALTQFTYSIDYQGDGAFDSHAIPINQPCAFTYASQGIYVPHIRTQDGTTGAIYEDDAIIEVYLESAVEMAIAARWQAFRQALQDSNVDALAAQISDRNREKFRNVLTKMVSKLPQMASDFQNIEKINIFSSSAQYRMLLPADGAPYMVSVNFIKGADGQWYVDFF